MAPKKLTEADKAAILGLYRQPEETTSTLAERYGVSNSTISRLLKASLPEADYKNLIQQKRGSVDRDPGSGAAVAAISASPEVPSASPDDPSASGDEPSEATDVPSASTDDTSPQAEATKSPPILKKRTATAKADLASDAAPAAPSIEAPSPEDASPQDAPSAQDTPQATPATPRPSQDSSRRQRSRSRSDDNEEATQLALSTDGDHEDLTEDPPEPVRSTPAGPIKKAAVAKAEDSDDDDDWDDNAATLDDDDYDEEDDDDEEDDAWDGDTSDLAPHLEAVEITPLTPSDLPSQCYLVVERVSSELVVLPLKTFASLGQIPEEEGDLRTLPVFENQQVARRFSRRNQRVIKVPDGNLLQTTRPYLQAKGITRLLIDGHVFALEEKGMETPV